MAENQTSQFPTWRYHRTEPARIVQDQDELEQLGDDWYASPAEIPASEPAPDETPDDKAQALKKKGK